MINSISLGNDSRTACVSLGRTTVQISQTRGGAWRLLQVVGDTCDPMGAAQVLVEDLDGEVREEYATLQLSGMSLRGEGPTSLRVGEAISLLDAGGYRRFTYISRRFVYCVARRDPIQIHPMLIHALSLAE